MRRIFTFLLFLILAVGSNAQVDLAYYIPEGTVLNPNIPTPEDILGYQVGDWHVSHDKMVEYMRVLAEASDRISLEEYARSYEARPLLVLTITSSANQRNIKEIRTSRVDYLKGGAKPKKLPAVVYQGYSVHGNEPSGGNAALLVAYYYAAAQGAQVEKMLDDVILLLDPCFNPDGFNRFASWVNHHKSFVLDPSVQHPESQGKIKVFHKWKPNILTDFHEMGTNSTYFFQPGVPARTNPVTPKRNQELTGMIAEYHAKILDEIGSFYYTQESFDDYYYGKGSTYPDANGCIGILFEQASSRGHLQESVNGLLSFPFTIRNQFLTSLSTMQAGLELKGELMEYQHQFYNGKRSSSSQSHVFGDPQDPQRAAELVKLLLYHEVEVFRAGGDVRIDGVSIPKENAYVVPMNQHAAKIIEGMFATPTSFTDSIFYDISAWTMPHAFNLLWDKKGGLSKGARIKSENDLKEKSEVNFKAANYAYVLDWNQYYAPRVLNDLLNKGLRAKVNAKSFTIETQAGIKTFEQGHIMVPIQNQNLSSSAIAQLMQTYHNAEKGTQVYAVNTGLTPQGIELGSPNMMTLRDPKCLMLVGTGVNGYDAGEIWHLFDQRYKMELTLVEQSRVSGMNLSNFNVLIMPDGSYNALGGSGATAIKTFVQKGGTLIAYKRATQWLNSQKLITLQSVDSEHNHDSSIKPYDNRFNVSGAQVLGGAIFEVEVDLTHPIFFGYNRTKFPVFKRGTYFVSPPENPYASPARYTSRPLLAGYISDPNLKRMKGASYLSVHGIGRGKVVCFNANTNFRAFWYGTNKLLANAVFFGNTISGSSVAREDESEQEGHSHESSHGHKH